MIATSIFAGALAVTALALALMAPTWGLDLPDSWGFRGFEAMFAVAFSGSGFLILRRQPAHVVGWLLLTSGAISAVQLFAEEYGIASYHGGLDLPAASWIAWLNVWIWVAVVAMVGIGAVLYFPNGRLPSSRWRVVVWFAIIGSILTTISAMGDPAQMATNMRGVPPPYDPRSLGPLADIAPPLFATAGFGTLSVLALAAAVSVAVRFRRARGAERQQIKWFAFAAVGIGIAATLNALAIALYGDITPWPAKLAQYALIAAMALVPVSIGIAIRRYRLYDIDLVINRALVYGALSAVIGAVYTGFVVLFQTFVSPHVGGSEIGVAASTLATFALVQPVRRRIQGIVDRRFYRSRYNAVRTLDSFATRLRDEVDLDALRVDLLDVIGDTLRPAHAGVWLRGR